LRWLFDIALAFSKWALRRRKDGEARISPTKATPAIGAALGNYTTFSFLRPKLEYSIDRLGKNHLLFHVYFFNLLLNGDVEYTITKDRDEGEEYRIHL